MQQHKSLSFVSWLMTILLVFNLFIPTNIAYATDHGEDIMKDTSVTIIQDGNKIQENGKVQGDKAFKAIGSFDVTIGNTGDVKKGDTLKFKIADTVSLAKPYNNLIVYQDPKTQTGRIGILNIQEEGDDIYGVITFDGEQNLFDSNDELTILFDLDFKYGKDANALPDDGENFKILDKDFLLVPPKATIQYEMKKSGALEKTIADKKIRWTVEISATKNGAPMDLEKHIFKDMLNPAEVGAYIPDSFKINGSVASPQINKDELSYTFPANSGDKVTVSFETEIPDGKYNSQVPQKVENNATLVNQSDEKVADAKAEVPFFPMWINKTGESSDKKNPSGAYNPKDRTITWTIEVNQMGRSLKNVVIHDKLEANEVLGEQTFESAYFQKKDNGTWGAKIAITPQNDHYAIGDIHEPVLLTIITKVPDAKGSYTASELTYKNSATLKAEHFPGLTIKDAKAVIGYNAISKDVVGAQPKGSNKRDGGFDHKAGTIEWSITVNKRQQSIPNLAAYELFVYDKLPINVAEVTGFPQGMEYPAELQSLGQKYVEGSVTSNFAVKVYPIMKGGTRVADLVEIKGFNKDKSENFKIKSKIVAPEILVANLNEGNLVKNTVTLFSGTEKISQAAREINAPLRLLYKDMLKAPAVSDPNPEQHVNNSRAKSPEEGFNYKEKAVIYRLSINSDNANLSDRDLSNGQKMGKITVKDTLPDGWEFKDIKAGQKFLIFDGVENEGLDAGAANTTPIQVNGLNADIQGKEATFVFDSLDKTYIVLLKAGPTEETAKAYFSKNQTIKVTNTATLYPENQPNAVVTSKFDTTVVSKVLGKINNDQPNGEVDGTVLWTIDYTPNEMPYQDVTVTDILPPGIDLPTDEEGVFILEEDGEKMVTVKELILQNDGTYQEGAEVPLEIGKQIHYDKVERKLTFNVPDASKGYRLNYRTYITGDSGQVKNKAMLSGTSNDPVVAESNFAINDAHVRAILKKNGYIKITKIDADTQRSIEGVEFTLFTSNGTTPIRVGKTKADGTLIFKALPVGEYILKETKPAASYFENKVVHQIKVEKNGNTKTVFIDQTQTNEIAIKNYKSAPSSGSVKILKTVTGSAADVTKEFEFTILFSDQKSYPAWLSNQNIGMNIGSIASGDKVKLRHNDLLEIRNIPEKVEVIVTEDPQDYTPTPSNEQKTTIETGQVQELKFENRKDGGGGGNNPGGNPPTTPGGNPPNNPGGGTPPKSPVRPDGPGTPPTQNPPTQNPPSPNPNDNSSNVDENKIPLGNNPNASTDDPSKTDGKGGDGEMIKENSVPKAAVPKIKKAPKTGLETAGMSFGTIALGAMLGTVLLRRKKGNAKRK